MNPAALTSAGRAILVSIPLFAEELPWLQGEDRDWVMGRALGDWLGWKLPG